jgi:hypothetical protein
MYEIGLVVPNYNQQINFNTLLACPWQSMIPTCTIGMVPMPGTKMHYYRSVVKDPSNVPGYSRIIPKRDYVVQLSAGQRHQGYY